MGAPATLRPVFAAVAAAALAGFPAAQVPAGHAVLGTATTPGAAHPGPPGLFLVPLTGGPVAPIRVTGLPPELSTDGHLGYAEGCWWASIRPADGALLVTTMSDTNAPSAGILYLFVLHLNVGGTSVDSARTQRIALGQSLLGGVSWNAPLPDGRILVVAGDAGGALPTGAMANHVLAIVDVSGAVPAFTLLPNPPIPGDSDFGGIAIDPTGNFVYYLFSTGFNTGAPTARLWRYNLATGQSCPIVAWTGQFAVGIRCDDDGTVYVSATDPAGATGLTHFMHTVHPDGCNPVDPAVVTTVQSSLPLAAWGFDLVRASGQFAVISTPFGPPRPHDNALLLIDPLSGNATVIAQAPAGGWGWPGQCVAVNNAIDGYGAPTDGQNHYWFANFPNPGGQPTVGNSSFSLTMASAPNAPVQSILGVSFGRGSTSFAGVEILVDLGPAMLSFGAGSQRTWPLPIPNDPALRGLEVTAQSLHLEANNGIAASRGLTLTVQ